MTSLDAVLSSGLKLNYTVHNVSATGPPVICLHGYLDSLHSFDVRALHLLHFFTHNCQALLPHLRTNSPIYALSQRGWGNSSTPDVASHSLTQLVEDLYEFLSLLKLWHVTLVRDSA